MISTKAEEAASPRPFLANDEDALLLVRRGRVDLCLVPLRDGQPAGARTPLMRIRAGEAFLGIRPAQGFGVLAVPGREAALARLAGDSLRARLADPAKTELVLDLVDQWRRAVRSLAATDASPAGPRTAAEPFPWDEIRAEHERLVRFGMAARERVLREEEQQLRQRAAADAVTFEAALAAMAASMGETGTGLEGAAVDDPLLAACQLVGTASGIKVQPPPASSAASPVDPLSRIARASRVHVRKVTLSDGWWRTDAGPLLGTLQDGRPVALLPRAPGRYELVDPAEDARVRVTRAVAERLQPAAHIFYPRLPDQPLTVPDLLRFALARTRRDLLHIVALAVLAGVLALATPLATDILVRTVIPSGLKSELVQLGLGLAACALGAASFQLVRAVATLRMEGRANIDLEAALFTRLLALSPPFFRRFSAGDLAYRVTAVDRIRETLTGTTVSSVVGFASSLFSVPLLFYFDVQLGVVAMVGLLLIAASEATFAALQFKGHTPMQNLLGKIAGRVPQYVTGISKLRVAAAEVRAFGQWAGMFADQQKMGLHMRMMTVHAAAVRSLLMTAITMAVFISVAWSGFKLPAAAFLAFNTTLGQLMAAIVTLTASLPSLMMIGPTLKRAEPILKGVPEVGEGKADPGLLEGNVAARGVSFRYGESGSLVLNNVTFEARPGELVAIVGPSGCGKSTLVRVLLGFDRPETGKVTYDGQDLGAVDVAAVRRQIGTVLQAGGLLPGSILTNIIGSALLTEEDAWDAAAAAGLDADIEAMPMGMHTNIGEGASTLSGGQRQRLMLARALVGKPRYLFLDEATSALDSQTQERVSKNLEKLRVTRIVVAHRLSTIRRADRIYVMRDGRVVQVGTFDELMSQDGLFAELARRQMA